MSKIYLEILDKKRQAVFQKLLVFKQHGYLAGGTALSLQIKHRRSVDFDIFISKPVSNFLRKNVTHVFGEQSYYVNTGDQISFTIEGDIGITFVWYYYKPLLPLISTASLSLASIVDIAADKAHTIGRRAIWRDYVDLYTILKKGILSMAEIIQFAKRKFKGEFVEVQFLQQLSYFNDVKMTPIDFFNSSPPIDHQVQSFLTKQVEEYLDQVIPRG